MGSEGAVQDSPFLIHLRRKFNEISWRFIKIARQTNLRVSQLLFNKLVYLPFLLPTYLKSRKYCRRIIFT